MACAHVVLPGARVELERQDTLPIGAMEEVSRKVQKSGGNEVWQLGFERCLVLTACASESQGTNVSDRGDGMVLGTS